MRRARNFLIAALAVGALVSVAGSALAAPPVGCSSNECWNGSSCIRMGSTYCKDANGNCVANVDQSLTVPSIECVGSTGSSITLRICGTGTYGAPAGFSVQMKSKADFDADWAANPGAPCENRGWSATGSYQAWSLSGQCQSGNGPWSLSQGECVDLIIDADFVTRYITNGGCGASGTGAILTCGTEYIFRVFAHNYTDNQSCPQLRLGQSGKGPTDQNACVTGVVCSTAPCQPDGGCTFTWGYWKTHGPDALGCSPGNQADDWDLTSFPMANGLNLTQAQVCDIFQTNPGGSACGKGAGANAVIILEHQLFAAMLNVADTAITCPFATQAIEDAKQLLAGQEFGCVGVSTPLGQQMIAVKDLLAAYNSDICDCPVPNKPQAAPGAATGTNPATWGKVKVRYR